MDKQATTRDRYMLEEEREDDARMRQGEPHTWSESWLFIAPALIISLVVLWFASQGAL